MPSLGLDYQILREHNPSLVMASISNFGQTGPYRDNKATEIVAYALGGLMYIFGSYDREPLKHALHQAQFKAGTDAASAALMALYHQRLTGEGQHVDVSVQEAIASTLRMWWTITPTLAQSGGGKPNHSGDLTRLRAASDGYILPNPGIGAGLNWRSVVEFLEEPELDDERFADASARLANAEELGKILDRCFETKKKTDVFYAAHERRFIYGIVQSPEEVLDNPQYQHRGYFVEQDHPIVGPATYPGAPFIMSGTPWEASLPAPFLGRAQRRSLPEQAGLLFRRSGSAPGRGGWSEHGGAVGWDTGPGDGPINRHSVGDEDAGRHGRQVVRLESTLRMESYRGDSLYQNDTSGEFWNRGGNFYEQNRNKLGITLDLSKPQGLGLLKELVAISDVFAENFTPRVIRNFHLEYEDLRRIKPDIIMVSSTGYGSLALGPTSGPPAQPQRARRAWPT